ncbi:MerR family transcriptional regulator [Lacticaseibacillus saniviri]|uniref:HTH merR-type domain-containing protein n=1 Tax=Lacticaseibacillus saniviri JCM 17471 = DSM 24301 TaxID=1293598 RepID=A0A0R2MT14_9LACO|nr:MerR family transcriptional regulator [Lacticaseibacillus saniviri]KRO16710.1 hypothetical protein IV56_GL000984 [Lacticaseibacillus saniviri JCM 17471 = DSM 24301]
MYQIQALAKVAGVSVRTLRYYHEIGLLVPQVAPNGYRQYSEADVDTLQLIVMYRQLDFSLAQIKQLLTTPASKRLARLKEQQVIIAAKRTELDQISQQLAATIHNQEEAQQMSDKQKFEAFKHAQIKANDDQYGAEVTARFGSEQKRAADQHFGQLTQAQYQQMQEAEQQLTAALKTYLAAPALPSAAAEAAFQAHRDWLQVAMPDYTPQIHQQLAAMYVADERFGKYYTKLVGDRDAAVALEAIVSYYTKA